MKFFERRTVSRFDRIWDDAILTYAKGGDEVHMNVWFVLNTPWKKIPTFILAFGGMRCWCSGGLSFLWEHKA